MSNQPENEPEELMEDAAKNDTVDAAPETKDPVDSPEGAAEEPAARKRRINPVTLITLLVLAVCAALFVWHLMADRFTPYTEQARVETFIVPVVPQVSGYLVEIPVVLHERVHGEQVLAQIDREPFELAVRSARAALANAGQQVGAQTAGVESAAGRLGVSRARLERSQRNYDRMQRVSERNPGALSEADRDAAQASLEQAQAQLISSKAELERAKQTLGSEGPDNPMIESAAAALPAADVETLRTQRILRFAIGISLGMALATGIAWPLSFLTPVLVGLLLSSPAPLTLRTGIGFVAIIAVAMGASFIFSVVFLSYPVVFLVLVGLLLFRIFHAASGDAHPLSILWMVVGFCVIPLVTLSSAQAGAIVAVFITIGAAVAVALALLVQGLIPDPVVPSAATALPTPKPTPEASERFRSAAISTLAVWPLLVLFYVFQLTGDLLVLIFVAILAISANLQAGFKGGTALIIANVGGGVFTILIYNLLVAVPDFGFFVVLMLLTTLLIGQRRFSDAPTAGLYGSAMNTVLIVIGGVTTSTGEAGAEIYVRIAQIIIAVIYIVVSLGLLESLWKREES